MYSRPEAIVNGAVPDEDEEPEEEDDAEEEVVLRSRRWADPGSPRNWEIILTPLTLKVDD